MTWSIERFARRWWSGGLGWAGAVLSVVTIPLAWVWGGATALRNTKYDRLGGGLAAPVPVLSVGNLAVGGTGKTPLAAWLLGHLAERGRRPGLVSGGYGRDELLLHRQWRPDVPVVAQKDRVAAATTAFEQGATVVVLDDGFQHRRLRRDMDIVLIAAEDPFPGRVLPRGPYRETARALRRAQVVVLTRKTASLEQAREHERTVRSVAPAVVTCGARLAPGGWSTLATEDAGLDPGPILAVAAIARPESFSALVREVSGAPVELLAFPDHHEYSSGDVDHIRARAAGRPIAVTEKDAVKLRTYAQELDSVRVLSLDVRWEWGRDALTGLIDDTLSGWIGR